MTRRLACLSLMLVAIQFSNATALEDPVPVEIGSVSWQRDFDQTSRQARASGKPRLVLFQEVPG